MHRVRTGTVSLLATVVLVLTTTAAVAQARELKVTGQQTALTPTAQVVAFLTQHHVIITANGAASLENGSVVLPIIGGHVSERMTGVLRHAGGLTVTHESNSITLHDFRLVRRDERTWLSAKVGDRRIRLYKVSDLKITHTGDTATVTGTLRLSEASARAFDRLLGTDSLHAGLEFGTLTSTVTLAAR